DRIVQQANVAVFFTDQFLDGLIFDGQHLIERSLDLFLVGLDGDLLVGDPGDLADNDLAAEGTQLIGQESGAEHQKNCNGTQDRHDYLAAVTLKNYRLRLSGTSAKPQAARSLLGLIYFRGAWARLRK